MKEIKLVEIYDDAETTGRGFDCYVDGKGLAQGFPIRFCGHWDSFEEIIHFLSWFCSGNEIKLIVERLK